MEHNQPKILFLIGAVAPLNSTNANLMLKLILPLTGRCGVHVLSVGDYREDQLALDLFGGHGITLYKYSTRTRTLYTAGGPVRPGAGRRLACRLTARVIDRNGFQDAFDGLLLCGLIEQLDCRHHYAAVCACMEPYRCAYAAYRARTGGKKLLYLIDPPAEVVPGLSGSQTPFRSAASRDIVSSADLLITTPRIVSALTESGYDLSDIRVVSEEFPLFAPLAYTPEAVQILYDPEKINLLYCGWLRHEAFLMQLLRHLDDRFTVTFIGNGSQRLTGAETGAQIRTSPVISHSSAVNAIVDADILICIGNTYPVHIPSKVFEYVASGKPIINLYTLPDCPTLEYTRNYPLALNLSVTMDPEEAARRVRGFCANVKGASVPADTLAELYRSIDSGRIIRSICESIIREVSGPDAR